MSNRLNTVLYTGVTSDLRIRVHQHKNNDFPDSFTAKYNCSKLVYYENFLNIEEAIQMETRIKNWKREWKVNLINSRNPEWKDLYDELF